MSATDAELVRAVVAGDRAAVAAVWDRYARASRQRLRVKLGFGEDVEDLLQDVFVSFLSSVHRIRNQDSLRAYLLAIAATLASQEVRRRKQRRLVSLCQSEEMPENATPAPDFEGRESLLALQRALDRMPLRVGRSYFLCHVSGLELGEVARMLGVSCATAKRAVSRARQRLLQLGVYKVASSNVSERRIV